MRTISRRLPGALAIAGWAISFLTTPVGAVDLVRTPSGTVSGEISSVSREQVVVRQRNGERLIAAEDIEALSRTDEPRELQRARAEIRSGQLEQAVQSLEAVELPSSAPGWLAREAEYLRLWCLAQLALNQGGSAETAVNGLQSYVAKHAGSHRYYPGLQLLADLLAAEGQSSSADEVLRNLQRAPWPRTQARAHLALGQSLIRRKQFGPALREFELAQAKPGIDEELRQRGRIGQAMCQVATGQSAAGISTIEEIVSQADAENTRLHAEAYNALGWCFLRENRLQEALLAYLHVDIVYFQDAELHAEALAHLADIWSRLGRADRAAEAQENLQQRYPHSHWLDGAGDAS